MSSKFFVEVPFVFEADDYHEFDHLAQNLNRVRSKTSKRIKFKEVGLCNRYYIAVFYTEKTKEVTQVIREWEAKCEEE